MAGQLLGAETFKVICLLLILLFGAEIAAAQVGYLDQGSVEVWPFDSASPLSFPPAGQDFVQVTAGHYDAAALRSDGSIASWGWDSYGAVSESPAGTGFQDLAAGEHHSVAVASDGSLAVWGYDGHFSTSPPAGSDFTSVGSGLGHRLALRSNGTIAAWGWDSCDQVGHAPSGTGYVQVDGGSFHSVALRDDGRIEAWGEDDGDWNDYGQVTDTPSGADFIQVSARSGHNLALRSDGRIEAWGKDNDLQVSNAPTGAGYRQVAAGVNTSLAIGADGDIQWWGRCIHGMPTGYFLDIDAGYDFGVALKARHHYADLLVTDTGKKALLQRSVTVAQDAVIDTLMTVENGAVMTVDGSVICQPGSGLALIMDVSGLEEGDTVSVFDAAAWSGTFESFDLPELSPGLQWQTETLYTAGTLTVAPEPATLALLAAGLGALVERKRRN